jgi:hypothetical protein
MSGVDIFGELEFGEKFGVRSFCIDELAYFRVPGIDVDFLDILVMSSGEGKGSPECPCSKNGSCVSF